MDFTANLLAALSAPVFAALVGVACWISVRAGFRAFGLTLLLAPVAVLGIAADYVLDSGRLQIATVIVKEESVAPLAGRMVPDDVRRFVLQVRLSDGAIVPVETDSVHFDALAEGDNTGVLVYAIGPWRWIWADDFDRFRWLVERLHGEIASAARTLLGFAVVMFAAGLAALLLRRLNRLLVMSALGLGALAAGASAAAWGDGLRSLDKRALASVVESGPVYLAEVAHGFNRGASRVALIGPYFETRLRFTPEGARDAVIAVDRIDIDGAALKAGDRVEIAYASAAPRRAEMTGRSRAYLGADRLADLYSDLSSLTAVIALICAMAMLAYAFAWRRMRALRG